MGNDLQGLPLGGGVREWQNMHLSSRGVATSRVVWVWQDMHLPIWVGVNDLQGLSLDDRVRVRQNVHLPTWFRVRVNDLQGLPLDGGVRVRENVHLGLAGPPLGDDGRTISRNVRVW